MIEEEVKTEERVFKLPNKKVKVVPIKRKGAWLSPGHEASFLFGNAGKKYAAPLAGPGGRIKKVLTNPEEKFLSNIIARDLNVFNKVEDNYRVTRFVRLDKGFTILDLSDPEDYISYKILLHQPEEVVEGGDNKFSKGGLKYFIDDLQYEDRSRSKSATAKKDAYKEFGKLTSKGKNAMMDFLNVYYQNKPGKTVPQGANETWLESALDKIIEDDIDGFLFISQDPDYDMKVLITMAVKTKALLFYDNKYHTPDQAVIANSTKDLILYLNNDMNQETVLQIKARIEA